MMIALTSMAIASAGIRAVSGAEVTKLDRTLQGKAVVAQVHADWCPVCKAEKPAIDAVRAKYGTKITYVGFDVTNDKTAAAAAEQAKRLGLSSFFEQNKAQTGAVAVINPSTGAVAQALYNATDVAAYEKPIDAVNKQLGR